MPPERDRDRALSSWFDDGRDAQPVLRMDASVHRDRMRERECARVVVRERRDDTIIREALHFEGPAEQVAVHRQPVLVGREWLPAQVDPPVSPAAQTVGPRVEERYRRCVTGAKLRNGPRPRDEFLSA